ncbi:MAG: peptidase S24, partial [Candidatus Roizmanbacteria bacterium]|nr:peptidase S24 [Candidatus Roizmanbacteria bacterium]
MRLYSGSSKDFIRDVVQNKIVDILTSAFIYENNYRPGNSEINSWRNSLRMMCIVFQDLQLSDQGVILEYQLPLTSKRLDCMICGRDKLGKDSSVIVELKQWEKCDSISSEKVLTYTGQGMREVLHPSVQVGSYKEFLEDNHTAFYGENAIKLDACSFLHNYHSSDNDPIFSEIYKSFYEKYPLFLENNVEGLKEFILEKIINGY